ncbi:hypothetical protein QFC19_004446 [Naganishia cerealis]|uniref:Uncharacterized protein n=1 Tax=Naganishia cerealis TaxID=610337 RepID=A0ACC2VVY6_9TREE|nr:hypothetical protein QFC19_004446 [Naganishia cerealis]
MTNSKKAEKAAEEKYDVVYHYPNLDLHTAAVTGNVGLVHYALTHGQPVNSILHGLLPIHAACSGGSEQVVRMLIDRGADVNAPRLPRRYFDSKQQSTILGHASSTPLHFAAANGHDKIVRILLACGAVQKPDKRGNTPEMIAEQAGYKDIVETFRTWEAMVDEEREKVREREEEEKKDLSRNSLEHSPSSRSEANEGEDEDENHVSPILEKQAAWKGKGRADSFTDQQQKVRIRKSIDHMFGGRRGGSLRVASAKSDKAEAIEPRRSMEETASGSSTTQSAQPSYLDDDRRSSLAGFFGRAAHPAISLREALHRRSHASDASSDIHHFRGRSRAQHSEDAQYLGPPSLRQMSKQSLLQLFRRAHNGSPPSLSPSPPRTTIPILPTDDLDESVERIKRLSMDGIRPGSASFNRPRSGSQVNFQNPLVSRSSSIGGSSGSHDHSKSVSAPYSKTEFGEETPLESALQTETSSTARDTLRPHSSQSTVSETGVVLKPLSRINTQLANSIDASSDDKKEQPRSILKTRADTLSSPTSPRGFARLSPWHEPSTPSPLGGPKPRSATMPTSYFQSPLSPQQIKSSETSTPHGSKGSSISANDDSPDFDRREKEDGMGESIWDRAAARNTAKSRSRGASFTSITSSGVSAMAQAASFAQGMSLLQEPEGTDWTLPTQRPMIRIPSLRRSGRSRNNTVSTMTSTASNGAFSFETMDSNLTPPSLSSSHFASGSSGHPMSEDGLSVKERLVRRVSQRRADGPNLLYAVPTKGQAEEGKEEPEIDKAKREAMERRKRTEQEILKAVAHSGANESSLSLAEQLAAYGDIMAMQDSLSNDSHDRPPSDSSSSAQVSRSYLKRPSLHKSDSTDSNATIKTENSRHRRTLDRKASSVPVSTSHSRRGSQVGSKPTIDAGEKMDVAARQEALQFMPSLDTLFTTRAPAAAIPSINRIYETRAAAYRDKGLALKRQAPLYGSSSTNPNRPPVKIEDHWLIAGIGQKKAGEVHGGQARQRRAASMGTHHPAMEERENVGPLVISVPMMISHTDAPLAPSRKSGRGADRPTAGVSSNKVNSSTSVQSPAKVPVSVPSSPDTTSRLGKTLTHVGAGIAARRHASGPSPDVVQSLDAPPKSVTKGGGAEESPPTALSAAGGTSFKSGHTSTVEARFGIAANTSGSGEVEQIPAAVATHKHHHRWGDGFKSAMRLGKSRS